MWTALHPEGEGECFFSREVPVALRANEGFDRVWFFSMSAYLRGWPHKDITIEMPDTAKRLEWLGKLMPGR
jgi:hypothetical protein